MSAMDSVSMLFRKVVCLKRISTHMPAVIKGTRVSQNVWSEFKTHSASMHYVLSFPARTRANDEIIEGTSSLPSAPQNQPRTAEDVEVEIRCLSGQGREPSVATASYGI